jgi:hypothetical protein
LSDDLKKSIDAVHDLIDQDEMNASAVFGRSSQGEHFDEDSEDSSSEDTDDAEEEDFDVSKAELRQHNRKKRIERFRRQEAKRPEDEYVFIDFLPLFLFTTSAWCFLSKSH